MNDDETSLIRTIGRYQAITELGRGAMGIVYKGYDPTIGRTVALKTIAFGADDAQAKEFRRRLYVEASAAGALTHPNIVTVYDVIEDGTTTAVAMEFVEGQTLATTLEKTGALPLDQALTLFEQICAGLDYAGAKGIVHRDIKPANILVGIDGRPKIADFGIARLPTSTATQIGMVLGSPSYMSPEQVRGLPLDRRSDLFSAATLFFEMVTLENPFGGTDAATTMYRIAHEPPALSSRVGELIGPPLAAVLNRALAKDPVARFGTGAELVAALKDAALGRGPQATVAMPAATAIPSATTPLVVPAPAKAWQKFGLAAGIAGLAIAGTAGFFLLRGGHATPPSATDPLAAVVASTPGATVPATPGVAAPAPPAAPAATTPAAAPGVQDGVQPGVPAAPTGSTSPPPGAAASAPPGGTAPAAPAPAPAVAPDAAHPATSAGAPTSVPHTDRPVASPEAAPKPSEAAAPKSASADAAMAGPTGTLFIDFANTFPDGSIEVEIDGRRRWSEKLGLSQGVGGLSKLKLQRVSEQLGSELKVAPGNHRITVTLLNADGEVRDIATTSLNVVASRSGTLRIRLTRFKNKLQLENAAGEPDSSK